MATALHRQIDAKINERQAAFAKREAEHAAVLAKAEAEKQAEFTKFETERLARLARQEAADLFEQAIARIEKEELETALPNLQRYITHEGRSEDNTKKAKEFIDQIQLAMSDKAAAQLLLDLDEKTFQAVRSGGQWPEALQLAHPALTKAFENRVRRVLKDVEKDEAQFARERLHAHWARVLPAVQQEFAQRTKDSEAKEAATAVDEEPRLRAIWLAWHQAMRDVENNPEWARNEDRMRDLPLKSPALGELLDRQEEIERGYIKRYGPSQKICNIAVDTRSLLIV